MQKLRQNTVLSFDCIYFLPVLLGTQPQVLETRGGRAFTRVWRLFLKRAGILTLLLIGFTSGAAVNILHYFNRLR